MSWQHFGDLRSALVDHDWRTVAWLMDLEGGCENERARRYAYDALMRLRPDQRPFRIAVGAGKVGRSSLTGTGSANIWEAMRRKNTWGGNYVLAPLYGYTMASRRLKNWEGWNTQPAPIRPTLAAARLDVVRAAIRPLMHVRGEGIRVAARQLEILSAIVGEMGRDVTSDGHDAMDRALLVMERQAHPRLSNTRPYMAIDGNLMGWTPKYRALADEVLSEALGAKMGAAVVGAVRFVTAGGWQVDSEQSVEPLIEYGQLRAHLLRAAGVWLVPSPLVGGQPERHATTEQVSLLAVAAQDDGQMTLLAGA